MNGWSRFALRHAGRIKWLLLLVWLTGAAGVIAGRWRPPSGWPALAFLSVGVVVAAGVWARWRRERAIRESPLPQFLKRKLRETFAGLTQKDAELVERGLRQFFLACNRSPARFVAMPSRAVDAMWHEFILHTQAYQRWCELSLGRFLHHVPAEALGPDAGHNDGLRRAWYWCCRDESINPRRPSRLPLLFALDQKLQIANGFHYLPDCGDIGVKSRRGGDSAGVYCATAFSDGSASGDADSLGGADGGSEGWGFGGGEGGCGGGWGGGGGD
ncbi:MAG: hypothetical protein NVS3B2_08060 [Ramlibacter sp.]